MGKFRNFLLSKDTSETIECLKVLEAPCVKEVEKVVGEIHVIKGNTEVGKDVFTDLELLVSYNGEKGVIENINRLALSGSQIFLRELLLNPVSDPKILVKRQEVIKSLDNTDALEKLKGLEESFLWMYTNAQTDELMTLYNMVFFSNILTQPLNRRSEVLTGYNIYRIIASPLIGIFSPIVYFVIPYLVVRMKMKLKMSFMSYLSLMFKGIFSSKSILLASYPKIGYLSTAFSLIFYFQGIFNSVEVAKASYQISNFITKKMNDVTQFINLAEDLVRSSWSEDMRTYFFIGEKDYKCKGEFSSVSSAPFSVFSNFGKKLSCFKYFNKGEYKTLLRRVYIIDTISSIKQLPFSFPTYLEKKPVVETKGLWHPSLKTPVTNNLKIEKSLIITGPNAGGKSTLIKSALLSVIFAQTLSVTNAKAMSFTPFYYINSQMNIPDCKGKESLFEAEMYRSKANLDKLKELEGKRSIIFMDEIFNSTNPVEGISGAYAIAKHMSSYESNLSVITTHYLYLTKLSKNFPERFQNLKMNVIQREDEIKYPYKVSPGISRQYIALELLKKNGFDKDVVEDALEIKERLSQCPKPS